MCGIVGVVGTFNEELVQSVNTMLATQTHRGPDDSGFFQSSTNPGAIFGFRRLAILDLTADGHQPMIDERQGNVVVFNGEIYNFSELRKTLEAEGDQFRSRCDTEVLLKAYARFGVDVVRHIAGMFAFAIFDPRENRVVIARDRLGIKPLYYAEIDRPGGKAVLFSSELRSILATRLVAPRLDPRSLDTYLWNGFVPGPHTMVEGISLLPPGTTLTIDATSGRRRIERYWSLGPRAPMTPQTAKDALEAELLTTAKQHLVSDVPLGIFLSGGVDSSAVAALAVRSGSSNVKTFHIGFEETGFDESAYARRVANALGTEHAEFQLTQSVFVKQLDAAIASLDQPTFDAINTYFVSRVVREAGFTVALAGTGGDELFGGYESFRTLSKARDASNRVRSLPIGSINQTLANTLRSLYARNNRVPPQTRWAKLGKLLATKGDPVAIYQTLYALFTPQFLEEMRINGSLSPDFDGLSTERRAEFESVIAGQTSLSATSTLELGMFIGERLLRDSDAASMAVSLELRVPLLDHRVVEAVQRVPDELRFRPLGKKSLLKSLAMPQLDPTIFDRPKAGFVLPISVWAKDRLADDIASTFSDKRLVESVGLRHETLGRLWRSFTKGSRGMYWSRVWAPYVLLRWCRTHSVSL
jgi:asparagine synthase (glutamine-hydrolysing)